MTYTLPDLEYDYDALEPYIDEATMRVHHDKHHKAYMEKFVSAIQGTSLYGMAPDEILKDLAKIPKEIKPAVVNNGGGYVNHSLFWKIMGPGAGGTPKGKLANAINEKFGSFDKFKEEFSNAAATQFGSGWAWLVVEDEGLAVLKTSNQDTPLSQGRTPILALDVWEHAYYLKYQNKRPEYIENFWKVVKWKHVEKLYDAALD